MDVTELDSLASKLNCTVLSGLTVMEVGLLGLNVVREVVDFDLTWGVLELDETLALNEVREAVVIDESGLDIDVDND